MSADRCLTLDGGFAFSLAMWTRLKRYWIQTDSRLIVQDRVHHWNSTIIHGTRFTWVLRYLAVELHKLVVAPSPSSEARSAAASLRSDCSYQELEPLGRSQCKLEGTEPFHCSDLKRVTKIKNFRLCTTKLNNLLMIKRSSNTRVDFQLKTTSFTFVASKRKLLLNRGECERELRVSSIWTMLSKF